MLDKLLKLISEILSVSIDTLSEESSSENVEKWDSLAHMGIIFAIEDEFGITVSDEEIPNSTSVQQLLNIIQQ